MWRIEVGKEGEEGMEVVVHGKKEEEERGGVEMVLRGSGGLPVRAVESVRPYDVPLLLQLRAACVLRPALLVLLAHLAVLVEHCVALRAGRRGRYPIRSAASLPAILQTLFLLRQL
ncbi:hypothetical protein AB1Y20_012381 [Prymnesium parvum]|uniref:Uncharacterized protein n=1 Tax=Prymnesium parvum TaxID=97485 RepID=A0AB34IRX4_PRYPA